MPERGINFTKMCENHSILTVEDTHDGRTTMKVELHLTDDEVKILATRMLSEGALRIVVK
jgi:hypothetical protein